MHRKQPLGYVPFKECFVAYVEIQYGEEAPMRKCDFNKNA